MPDFTEREDQEGITLAREGSAPLHFATRQEYADWQRRYLYCALLNGAPSVCFQLRPPQTLVARKATHRLRHG